MRRRFVLLLISAWCSHACAQDHTSDVVYLHEGGAAFTFDVFRPATSNHAAVIWLVSGGWFSRHDDISPDLAKAFTSSGFTVFEVVHGSQPRYKIPEIVSQVRRAVRYIHAHSADYGIDANRIGISGISAGGHLSMMVAGLGDAGMADAKDPVDRASSQVNAVAEIAGPTDFLNWGQPNVMPFDAPQMQIFLPAFGVDTKGPKEKVAEVAKATSPISYVKPGWPSILLVHGDADTLVPIQQAKEMDETLAKAGVDHQLAVIPGGGHDTKTWLPGIAKALEWFRAKLLR